MSRRLRQPLRLWAEEMRAWSVSSSGARRVGVIVELAPASKSSIGSDNSLVNEAQDQRRISRVGGFLGQAPNE